MNLGRLLLRSLRKKSRARPRAKPVRAAKKKASKKTVEKSAALTDQVLPSISAQTPSVTTHLLIHPGDRLRSSIEAFLLDRRSPHTRRAYGKDLRRFLQFLAARKREKGSEPIDRAVLVAYKNSLLSEALEHTTVDRHLATLRSFFRFLVDDGHLEKNPAEGVRLLNPKRASRTKGLSDADVISVLKQPDLHSRSGSLHYAILMVLFFCGLRRSELCELKTSNLSIERGHRVLRLLGKGGTERTIVLPEPVYRAIEHYFRISSRLFTAEDYLFRPVRNNRTGIKNKPLDPSAIFYIVTMYAKKAGVGHRVSPHSCRATAISNARDHHVPDRAIQELAGWVSPDRITRYDKRKASVENSASKAIHYGDGADRTRNGAKEPTSLEPQNTKRDTHLQR